MNFFFFFFFFFFNTLLIWLPWKTKIKSVLNKLKVYKKISCSIFFFFFFWVVYFCFCYCLVRYWSIGKTNQLIWAYNIAMLMGLSSIRKHFSLEAANFSLFSQLGEVTSPLISRAAWTLRLQFTKYQQRYAPMKFFYFFIFFFFFVIPEHWIMQEPVYVLHLITCHGRIMPRLAELLFK